MAMTMTGEALLPTDVPTAWARLNDAETLRRCITGCESLERDGDELRALVKLKVGPVKASFRGKVTLSEIDAPHGCRISGEGEGGVAGFAKGGARVRLTPAEGGTLLTYDVEAGVGGKLAQLGSRLVDGLARKMADEFFAAFTREVTAHEEAGPDGAAPESGPSSRDATAGAALPTA